VTTDPKVSGRLSIACVNDKYVVFHTVSSSKSSITAWDGVNSSVVLLENPADACKMNIHDYDPKTHQLISTCIQTWSGTRKLAILDLNPEFPEPAANSTTYTFDNATQVGQYYATFTDSHFFFYDMFSSSSYLIKQIHRFTFESTANLTSEALPSPVPGVRSPTIMILISLETDMWVHQRGILAQAGGVAIFWGPNADPVEIWRPSFALLTGNMLGYKDWAFIEFQQDGSGTVNTAAVSISSGSVIHLDNLNSSGTNQFTARKRLFVLLTRESYL